jgi:hypothetical protein
MSADAPWFRCFPSELLNEVGGMTPDAGLVYLVVLLRIFDADGPVADDAGVIARRTGLSAKRSAAAIEWLVSCDRITKLENGRYDIPKTHDELAHRKKRLKDAQSAGNASALKRLLNQRRDPTPVQQPSNYIDSESESKKTESEKRAREERALCAEAFGRFWRAWPHKVGKPAAENAFRRHWQEADAIVAGIQIYIAAKPADRPWLNPATFIRQERWKDQPAPPMQSPPARKFATADAIRTVI